MADVSILSMASNHRDFTSIRIIIQSSMTQRCSELDELIIQLVRDAQLVLKSPSNMSLIDRDLFYYSMYLGEKGKSWVGQLNPDNLVEDDFEKILEVFSMP